MTPIAIGLGLLAVSVAIHATVLVLLFRWLRRLRLASEFGMLQGLWILVRVAVSTVSAHLLEIVVWALAYRAVGALPTLDTAVYFSEVTYTTVGYGDVTIPARWHLVAGLEAVTGIVLAGWSAAALFAVVTRLLERTTSTGGSAA
jgi:hypothetical protein